MNDTSDIGLAAVRRVYQQYGVDAQWSVEEERGFSWWAHHYRQRIWAEPGFEDAGITIYRLCARTDFLRDITDQSDLPQKLVALAMHASMAMPVFDPQSRTLSLFTSVYIHEETAPVFAERLFGPAALIQPIEAEIRAAAFAEPLGGKPNVSEHPENGFRPTPDEMLGAVDLVYRPKGEQPSPWLNSGDFEETARMLNQGNSYANASKKGLTAEFAFSDVDTTLLQAFSDIRHPQLGSGLMLQHRVRTDMSEVDAALVSTRLNLLEVQDSTRYHTLGSWTLDPHDKKTIVFVSFIPAFMYDEFLLVNLCFNAAARSRWVSEVFLGEDAGGSVVDAVAQRFLAIFPAGGNA